MDPGCHDNYIPLPQQYELNENAAYRFAKSRAASQLEPLVLNPHPIQQPDPEESDEGSENQSQPAPPGTRQKTPH